MKRKRIRCLPFAVCFLRSLKQAQYSPDNLGHFGLSLEDYAHFTSPIRRYPDLIVHRQLRHMLEQTEDGVLEFQMKDFDKEHGKNSIGFITTMNCGLQGRHTSDRERKSMDAERDVLELSKVQFAAKHIDDDFMGTIVRMGRFGLSVRLDPHFVDGTLPFIEMKDDYYDYDEQKLLLMGRRSRKIYKVGDKISVKVVKADLETAQIILTCLNPASTNVPRSQNDKEAKNAVTKAKRKTARVGINLRRKRSDRYVT